MLPMPVPFNINEKKVRTAWFKITTAVSYLYDKICDVPHELFNTPGDVYLTRCTLVK